MHSTPVTGSAARSTPAGGAGPATAAPVLEIEELSVRFATPDGEIPAVNAFSLAIRPGECVGVVGESGAGKSQSFLAVMGLLASNAKVEGRARFEGRELLGRPADELNQVRGSRLAMIFQDPMTSLTPHMRVGDQIAESLLRHTSISPAQARARALALLNRVHVTDAERRLDQYPHELSGGMRQRVMIAVALACDPVMLIADEPTTALDVTIQAQILQLLAELKRDQGMAMVLVTHDLGVVAGIADRVAVMYGGRLVELGSVRQVLKAPRHPYTQALLRSMPRVDEPADAPLLTIQGQPPNPRRLPPGCAFHPRCSFAQETCRHERPPLVELGASRLACHFPVPAPATPPAEVTP
ncbi:MAG: ABC transporter ATP-binding protein [Steroidobacteraceae bacterium]|jgi:oligopeptide transport system ATP-binding protein|nr:ABC transporter ATP-binding protein [Steroidobacteraceae bacterium]